MEFYIEKQLLNIVYSVILGLILGALYDIIRKIHVSCGIASYSGGKSVMKAGKIPFLIFFLTDFVYMLSVTALYSLYVYWADNARFRTYLLISAALGFYIYYSTVGRAVMLFSETLVAFIRRLIRILIITPVKFIVGVVFKSVKFIYALTLGKLINAFRCAIIRSRTKMYLKKLKKDIVFKNVK